MRWLTPQLSFSRLPKLMMSSRIWPECRCAPKMWKMLLAHAEVDALDHRQEDAAALGVLAAVLAQIRVLRDVGVPRRRLFGGGERAARRR